MHGRGRLPTQPAAPGRARYLPLAVMREGPAYGYEMTKRLRARGLSTVGEGSIYPLLGRLERDGLVETRRAASNGGPPRKYYSLSPAGEPRSRPEDGNGGSPGRR